MISICIKSNCPESLVVLEHELDNEIFPQIYYSQKKFKNYFNLIIHYKGKNKNKFYHVLSNNISNFIIKNYEEYFIMKQLNSEFFYFSLEEKKSIFNLTKKYLHKPIHVEEKLFALKKSITNYFTDNKICILEGFINFRIGSYLSFISSSIDNVINDFIIEKEYSEYISLLSEYISIQPPQSNCVHLIYDNANKLLLDDNTHIITNASSPKIYLSDISFSSNDFILNSLLSLLPEKLCVHLNTQEDNFITFLKLIFNNRVTMCNSCNTCNKYFKEKKLSREPLP